MNIYDEDDIPDGGLEMDMPTPCFICGDTFELMEGHPCHKCHQTFCRKCARDTDVGWRCAKCETEKRRQR